MAGRARRVPCSGAAVPSLCVSVRRRVNVSIRLDEDPKLCLLVVIGVREDGDKEFLAVEVGYRESEDS